MVVEQRLTAERFSALAALKVFIGERLVINDGDRLCCPNGSASVVNNITTRNSSGDEIANVNFLYDDIVHAVKIQ